MKLKTLLAIFFIIALAALAVSCTGTVEQTDPPEKTTGTSGTTVGSTATSSVTASTTASAIRTTTKTVISTKNTTKKWTGTKQSTTKVIMITVTTTRVSTALAPDYRTKLPPTLPGGKPLELHIRIGLDAEADMMNVNGNASNIRFGSARAKYGNALSFCNMPDNSGGFLAPYVKLIPFNAFTPEGIGGVLWYIDFSQVEPDPTKSGPCASIGINSNYRSDGNSSTPGSAVGYYYKDGEWVLTTNVNLCRMQLPEGFAGWVYVPLSSYSGAGLLYDASTGIGTSNAFITSLSIFVDHYKYSNDKPVTVDEILFVG